MTNPEILPPPQDDNDIIREARIAKLKEMQAAGAVSVNNKVLEQAQSDAIVELSKPTVIDVSATGEIASIPVRVV